jgi:methylated-DNA-protein-cysteine methyltransferase-like protein
VVFKEKVLKYIKAVPKGKVVSYGQVAANCGKPKGAREVGWILRGLSAQDAAGLPWWRVVNQKGFISIKGNFFASKFTQKELLEKDGVEVGRDFILNMEKYKYGK